MPHDKPNNSTQTPSPFGQSVEGLAQKHDSATIGSSSIAVTSTSSLRLYRMVPLAADDDPNWDNAPSHGEVFVCAESPADARIVAAANELDFMDIDAVPAEGVTTVHASAFRNDKLYTVLLAGPATEGMVRGIVDDEMPMGSAGSFKPE